MECIALLMTKNRHGMYNMFGHIDTLGSRKMQMNGWQRIRGMNTRHKWAQCQIFCSTDPSCKVNTLDRIQRSSPKLVGLSVVPSVGRIISCGLLLFVLSVGTLEGKKQ